MNIDGNKSKARTKVQSNVCINVFATDLNK